MEIKNKSKSCLAGKNMKLKNWLIFGIVIGLTITGLFLIYPIGSTGESNVNRIEKENWKTFCSDLNKEFRYGCYALPILNRSYTYPGYGLLPWKYPFFKMDQGLLYEKNLGYIESVIVMNGIIPKVRSVLAKYNLVKDLGIGDILLIRNFTYYMRYTNIIIETNSDFYEGLVSQDTVFIALNSSDYNHETPFLKEGLNLPSSWDLYQRMFIAPLHAVDLTWFQEQPINYNITTIAST